MPNMGLRFPLRCRLREPDRMARPEVRLGHLVGEDRARGMIGEASPDRTLFEANGNRAAAC